MPSGNNSAVFFLKGGKRVTFVGDSIKQFLSEICKIMCERYKISALEASKIITYTRFDSYVQGNYGLAKAKTADCWADIIYFKSILKEHF